MDSEKLYGHYAVIRVSHNPLIDEWTNVGVIVFDENGNRVYARTGFDRAIARGDLVPSTGLANHLSKAYWAYDHVDQVYRARESLGHAMSSVQVSTPRRTILRDSYDDLFECYVLGKKEV